MSSSITHRYTFGENGIYFYEFKLNVFAMSGTSNKITTLMMVSTNMRKRTTDMVDPYINDLIQYIAKLCIEYEANYDAFHNHLLPYSYNESVHIAEQVHAAILLHKSQSQS